MVCGLNIIPILCTYVDPFDIVVGGDVVEVEQLDGADILTQEVYWP